MTDVYSALLEAQKSFPKIPRDMQGQIGTRQYGYAGLASILEAIGPVLHANGIIAFQRPVCVGDSGMALVTVLRHVESETEIEGQTSLPVANGDWQGWGSAVTYARRYSLLPMLGLAPEDDDDGAAASQGRPQPQQAYADRRSDPSGQPMQSGSGSGFVINPEWGMCPLHEGKGFFQNEKQKAAGFSPSHNVGPGEFCNYSDVRTTLENELNDILIGEFGQGPDLGKQVRGWMEDAVPALAPIQRSQLRPQDFAEIMGALVGKE